MANKNIPLKKRFRGLLPVVIDVETGGLDPNQDALLELAAVLLDFDEQGKLVANEQLHQHILPADSTRIHQEALDINGIKDPHHPFRFAISEQEAITELFKFIDAALEKSGCFKAVLVGHNAWFDLHFIQAAAARQAISKSPFHSFTTFDTATLSALYFGQTVLAKGLHAANISYNAHDAHGALYDTLKTADLFCHIVNSVQPQLTFSKKRGKST